MEIRKPGAILLVSVFTVFHSTGIALSQDSAKQNMKGAETDTKNAAKNTGHAVSTGTAKANHSTVARRSDTSSSLGSDEMRLEALRR